MLPAVLKTAHLLAIVVWVGGMFFAHVCLRPAVATLEAPVRLRLLHGVFSRFFLVVAVAAATALATGVWMMWLAAGSGARMPWHWSAMAAVGSVMVAVFAVIRWVMFPGLSRAVEGGDWPAAGSAVAKIRQAVLLNLVLGIATIAVVGLAGG